MTDVAERLSDLELLGHLIGTRESKRRYQGSLQPFFTANSGDRQPVECVAARELVRRWLLESLKSRPVFDSPTAVSEYLKIHFAEREYESFVVLFLDAQNRLIEVEELFRGTLTDTSVYPREVVKASLRHNAASLVLSHNHPSGIAKASRADEALTQVLKAALSQVDIHVLDHVVAAGPATFSFAENGLL